MPCVYPCLTDMLRALFIKKIAAQCFKYCIVLLACSLVDAFLHIILLSPIDQWNIGICQATHVFFAHMNGGHIHRKTAP